MDNFLGFVDFSINFSYPKKIVHSTIESEYLLTKPNFRYKKVNILLGSNATGKTSIGRALMYIFNFFYKKGTFDIIRFINDKNKEAKIEIDFLTDEEKMYRVNIVLKAEKEKETSLIEDLIKVKIFEAKIWKEDTYEEVVEKLEEITFKSTGSPNFDYIKKIDYLPKFGWLFTFPDIDANYLKDAKDIEIMDLKIFNNVMKTLDPCISNIEKLPNQKDVFIINHLNRPIIVEKGEITEQNKYVLSSGTLAGIAISYMLSSVQKRKHAFYYCDEQFPYIQTDIEKSILSLLINYLQPNTQLFFTTHNLDLVDLNFPNHTFTLLKKENGKIIAVNVEKYIKKNDINLRNKIENDFFKTLPNLNYLDALEVKNG